MENEQKNLNYQTKWNWGAFALPLPFIVAHHVYRGFIFLIPIVGSIIFGILGEKWALENLKNDYRDEEEFRKTMSTWNRGGVAAFIIFVCALFSSILIVVAFINFTHEISG